ncbi:MAG: molecular chaperone DnaJ [Polymorphobacter sp.]
MGIALVLAAALAWWLHKRGELLPNLARYGGTAAAALLALRMIETGRPLVALGLAGAGYAWWRMRTAKAASPADEARARSLLGLGPAADADAIQAAWRAGMARAHPDAGGSNDAARAMTAARDLLLARQRA